MGDLVHQAMVWVLPVVIAITIHEAAHGWMARRLGDDTAYLMGRVSFNPLRHIDPVGTILLPGILILVSSPVVFGYAKPVPVNFRRLRNPKRDMVWVAAAGPGINLILAFLSAGLLHLVGFLPTPIADVAFANLLNSLVINVALAVFNMLPLPPLDGGRVLVGLLPHPLDSRLARVERHGMHILIALLMLPPLIGYQLGVDLNFIAWLLGPPVEVIVRLIAAIAGVGL